MDAVNNFSKDLIILLIANTYNTVKNCYIIYKFEKRKIIEYYKLNKLINN